MSGQDTSADRRDIDYFDLNASVFTKNLYALAGQNHILAELLARTCPGSGLRLFVDRFGFVNGEYATNRQFCELYAPSPEADVASQYEKWVSTPGTLLVLGAGLGYGLRYLLDEGSAERILLYERDLLLLKTTLTLNDVAAEIFSGKLLLLRQDELPSLAGQNVDAVVCEPCLSECNRVEHMTVDRILRSGRTCERRAVLLSGSSLFTGDCASTLFGQGWDVFEVDPTRLTVEMTHYLIDALVPDLVFKINLLQGAEQFARSRPLVEWEIDPACSPMPEFNSDEFGNLFVFTHDPDRVSPFVERGLANVEYFPLCSNPRRLRNGGMHAPIEDLVCNVAFVGTLMRSNVQHLLGQLLTEVERLSREENDSWGEISKWLEALVANPPAVCNNSGMISELEALLRIGGLPDVVMLADGPVLVKSPVAEFLAYLWRKQVLSACLHLSPTIWGDDDWREDFPEHYQGFADHYRDLPRIYSAAKVNLDISRVYQPNVVTMRVFDVLAAGGFVLADRNDSLLQLFEEGKEIACYSTPEEAAQKISYYLQHEDERLEIARRGHEKVLRAHTFEHRLNHILSKVGLN